MKNKTQKSREEIRRNNIKKWLEMEKKNYPDSHSPMYWIFVDWGIINKSSNE